MKRPRLVKGALPLITALAVAGGPAWAQDSPTPAPETTTPPTSSLSDKEKAVLQKIHALKAPRWRSFGACRYDWAGWKLMPDGVRTTAVQCGAAAAAAPAQADKVAVYCDTFKLSVRTGDQAWSAWRLPFSAAESPARGGEDQMVAALCANATPLTSKP